MAGRGKNGVMIVPVARAAEKVRLVAIAVTLSDPAPRQLARVRPVRLVRRAEIVIVRPAARAVDSKVADRVAARVASVRA